MPTIPVTIVESFTERAGGGNPAGVVLEAEPLSDEQCQRIAAAVGASETAFVSPSARRGVDVKVRFFTPRNQVPMCGHATLAVHLLRAERGLVRGGMDGTIVRQETLAGIQVITYAKRLDTLQVFFDLPLPRFKSTLLDRHAVGWSIGVADAAEIIEEPVLASTGLWHLFVPLGSVENLFALRPRVSSIESLQEKYDVDTVAPFAVLSRGDGNRPVRAAVRNFAPRHAVVEDPATGTAAGALACCLALSGYGEGEVVNIWFEQGKAVGRESRIETIVERDGEKVRRVQAGGTGVIGREFLVTL